MSSIFGDIIELNEGSWQSRNPAVRAANRRIRTTKNSLDRLDKTIKKSSHSPNNTVNDAHAFKNMIHANQRTFGYVLGNKSNISKERAQKNYDDEDKRIISGSGRGELDAAKDREAMNKAHRKMKIHGESAMMDIEFK